MFAPSNKVVNCTAALQRSKSELKAKSRKIVEELCLVVG